MCRSEPQIAVDVTRTTASLRLRIVGSGTSPTSTVPRPIHRFARISAALPGAHGLSLALPSLVEGAGALGAAVGQQHLARLHHLLEPPQVVLDLLSRLLAEQSRH